MAERYEVWKFELDPGCPEATMPAPARVLHVGSQRGNDITIWALVDPEGPEEEYITRRFRIFGTGHPIPVSVPAIDRFVGTVLVSTLVFHVFEEAPV